MKFKAPKNVTAVAIGGQNYAVIKGVIDAPSEHAALLIAAGFLPIERADGVTHAGAPRPARG